MRHSAGAQAPRRALGAFAALGCLFLAACTIEVGPPPESDPPLVPEAQKAPAPPPQPTGPQPWSRDLDFDSAPAAVDRRQMAEGLVASDAPADYSGQRLTFESALDDEKPLSEAEQARKQAEERAAAAGKPLPPQVAAAPVANVDASALPGEGDAGAPPPRRESLLPPPPKFPPLPAKGEVTQTPAAPVAAEPAPEAEAVAEATPAAPPADPGADTQWAGHESRLPPPPKFPPLPAKAAAQPTAESVPAASAPEVTEAAPAAVPETAPVAAEAPVPAPEVPAPAPSASAEAPAEAATEGTTEMAAAELMAGKQAEAAAFATEVWDAPAGTILVQVSAVPDGTKVASEWQRLQARYPQVLKPLRLVVDEAKLGGRGVFYRVQAGAFESREGAAGACDVLISKGQACFVVVR